MMRFAIVESGGKQYRAVEGYTIDVDRLAHEVGKKLNLERVLLMGDEDTFMVGTPAVSGIQVSATVVEHLRGPKVISFKYRPKKRIRVKGGHRHHLTRLMIDFIGKPGEVRKVERPALKKDEQDRPQGALKPQKQAKASKKEAEGASVKKSEKKPASNKPASRTPVKKPSSKKK